MATYDILFGQLGGSGAPFGQFFLTGYAPPGPVTEDSFSTIGPDLWDVTDDNASIVLRFAGLDKTDGKRFLEEQIYQPLGLYSPVLSDGRLGLRRMNPILADAPYVTILNEDSFVQVGALEHDFKSLLNVFSIKWNHDPLRDELTRKRLIVDQASIDVHGEATTKELEWEGMHGSRHTDAALNIRCDSLRDRYAAPPLRMTGTLLHSYNGLEVGDVVRVQLEHVRDYTGDAGPIDRSFEIQRIAVNQTTGAVDVSLFASSQRASVVPAANGPAIPDAWYTSEGTELSTVCTISGGVIQAGTYNLTGDDLLNDSDAIYYYDGDLELGVGATLTVNDNVQIRVKGFFTINGTIDGAGRGHDGAVDDGVLASYPAGTGGYIGATRGWEGLKQYSSFSAGFFKRELARTVLGKFSAFPYLDLRVENDALVGLPLDMRGTSGSPGGRVFTVTGTPDILGEGGDGGDGGAALAIICRGSSFGINGEIDLSGGDPTAGETTSPIDSKTYRAGAGAPGGPGAMLYVIDGSGPSLPLVGEHLIAAYGTVNAGMTSAIGENSATVYWEDGASQPLGGFNTSIGGDVTQSMYRIQRVAPEQAPVEDIIVYAPKNFMVASNSTDTAHILTNTLPPSDVITEYFESITNDRNDAILIGSSTAGWFSNVPDPGTITYYWARNRNINTLRVSAFTPDTDTTTVIGAALAAPADGADGADGLDGSDGDSIHVAQIWIRAATTPATPTVDDGSYNFDTKTLTPPSGWTAYPPAANGNKLWSSVGTFAISGVTGTDNTVTWSTPELSNQDGITGILTNDSHVVTAANDGTGYSLTGAGGTFQIKEGIADVTTNASFSVVAPATKNGLTISIGASTGVYSLSGASWTSDEENFTLRASYGGATIDKVYTIAKSKTGAGGGSGGPLATVETSDLVGKVSTTTTPTNAFAGIRFLADGTWENNNANASSNTFTSPEDSGTWLIDGSSSDVWIEAELLSFTAGANQTQSSGYNTRLQMNATRTWVVDTSTVGAGVSCTMAIQFKFYDAAVGGHLLEVTFPRGWVAVKTP